MDPIPFAMLVTSGCLSHSELRSMQALGFDIAVPGTAPVQSSGAIPHYHTRLAVSKIPNVLRLKDGVLSTADGSSVKTYFENHGSFPPDVEHSVVIMKREDFVALLEKYREALRNRNYNIAA